MRWSGLRPFCSLAKSKNAELRLYKSIRCLILLDPGKDEDAIAYLTQALVARIQTLKQEEPEQNTRSRGMTRYDEVWGHPRDIQVRLKMAELQNLQTAELQTAFWTLLRLLFLRTPGWQACWRLGPKRPKRPKLKMAHKKDAPMLPPWTINTHQLINLQPQGPQKM